MESNIGTRKNFTCVVKTSITTQGMKDNLLNNDARKKYIQMRKTKSGPNLYISILTLKCSINTVLIYGKNMEV